MKTPLVLFSVVLLAACQPAQETRGADAGASGPAVAKATSAGTATTPAAVGIDVSTPDRALKSYWLAKDAARKAEYDWRVALRPEQAKVRAQLGGHARTLMTGDVLAAHADYELADDSPFETYSREIVDMKQDTESRATALVKVRNTTPLPAGAVLTDADKKALDSGERFRYVLEKDAEGWKVSQVYVFRDIDTAIDSDPWDKVFSPPSDQKTVHVWINQFRN